MSVRLDCIQRKLFSYSFFNSIISFFLTNYEDVFLFKSRYFIVFYCNNELLCLHLCKNLEIDNHKYPPLTVKDSIYRDGTERLRLRNTGVKTEGNTQ